MFTLKTRLFLKIMSSYTVLLLVVLLVIDSFMVRKAHQNYIDLERKRLETTAKVLSNTLPNTRTRPVLEPWARHYGSQAGLRVTLIELNGRILADNQSDPAQMDNHANLPEVQEALREGIGSSVRLRRTLGREELYFAYLVRSSDSPSLVLRVAVPLKKISEGFQALQRELLWISLLAILLAFSLGYVLTHSLTRRIQGIQEFSESIAQGNLDARVKDATRDELGSLAHSLNLTAGEMQRYITSLRGEKKRIEAILEGMRAGVLATDAEGRVTLLNPVLARILEVDPVEVRGKKVLEIVRNVELKGILDRVLAERKELTASLELKLAMPRSFEVVAVPLYEMNSAPSGVVAVLHDITRLEKLENIRKDFVANVSHELRTPLTSIRGFAETLLEGALEDKKNNRRFVEIIKAHAIHLSNLTMDLLALATLEVESFSLRYETVDLNSLVREVVEGTKPSAARKNQEISVCLADGLAPLRADREKLRQVLNNLLDNAIKFTSEEGKISVEAAVSADGRFVRLIVRDNGIGILSSDLPRIFERFYRVDKTRSRDQGGTGLGLAIVKHIVEAHKGKVEVESTLGQGSVFSVSLPVGS